MNTSLRFMARAALAVMLFTNTCFGAGMAMPAPKAYVAVIAGKASFGIANFRGALESSTINKPFSGTRRAFECGQAVARLAALEDGLEIFFKDEEWAASLSQSIRDSTLRFVSLIGHQEVTPPDKAELIELCQETETLLAQLAEHLR